MCDSLFWHGLMNSYPGCLGIFLNLEHFLWHLILPACRVQNHSKIVGYELILDHLNSGDLTVVDGGSVKVRSTTDGRLDEETYTVYSEDIGFKQWPSCVPVLLCSSCRSAHKNPLLKPNRHPPSKVSEGNLPFTRNACRETGRFSFLLLLFPVTFNSCTVL